MAKYFVLFNKFAGVVVEADNKDDAIDKANDVPESKYEYDPISNGRWTVFSAELIEDK